MSKEACAEGVWAPLAHVYVRACLPVWGCVHACLGWIHMGVWVFVGCCLNPSLTGCPSLGSWVFRSGIDTRPPVRAGWRPLQGRLFSLSQTLG